MAKRGINLDFQGFLVLGVAIAIGAVILVNNSRPQIRYVVAVPTVTATTDQSTNTSLGQALADVNNVTVEPSFTPRPTLPIATLVPLDGTPLASAQLLIGASPTPTRIVLIDGTAFVPTSGPTPIAPIIKRDPNPRAGQFSPPPELAPLSLDPRDHFWFRRPVDSSANSSDLAYYTYGSMGPQRQWRVHHGLDMPNPIGKEVRAAADGRVIWASDNYLWQRPDGNVDRAYAYGNVVIIQHDFGWQGQPLYTLYAHLSVIMPNILNTEVKMGDVIGLSGESGVVSGPHVHFEVRLGENWYYSTRNPILWMTPYEGHGVIAGRILYANGEPVEDALVTLTQGRQVIDLSRTYINPRSPAKQRWNVVSDEVWNENFVIGDIPAGDYTVIVNVNGLKLENRITVRPATTTFVDIGQVPFNDGPVTTTPNP